MYTSLIPTILSMQIVKSITREDYVIFSDCRKNDDRNKKQSRKKRETNLFGSLLEIGSGKL